MSIVPLSERVAGIDTHRDQHVACILDSSTGVMETREFAASPRGYRSLRAWLQKAGPVSRVGIEATGSYGAGLTRHLQASGLEVLEVIAPCRDRRRRQGKSDRLDAGSAAEAVLTRSRAVEAKTRSGRVESLRFLQATRSSLVKTRRQSLQVVRAHLVSCPEDLREELRQLTPAALLKRCRSMRPNPQKKDTMMFAVKTSLRALAKTIASIDASLKELDALINPIVDVTTPQLLSQSGIGHQAAAVLLLAAGENIERFRSEASFAMVCGVAPIPASSGQTVRHRLNRGGNRRANSALHMSVLCLLRHDPETKRYMQRRLKEGKTKREIIRCLKRSLARRTFGALKADLGRLGDPSPPLLT